MKLRNIVCEAIVLLVACGEVFANSYTDNANGTVKDTTTGLTWQKQDDITTRTWEAALTYCEGLSLGGQTDWRLPNVKELSSLLDDSRDHPAINPVFTSTKLSYYWSSSTYAYDTASAWGVDFRYGGSYYGVKTNGYYVRCVRGQ